jgi:hypothetical protein
MKILIGNTGLIGQTLLDYIKFDAEFNSKNLKNINNIDVNGSELYLSCLPATKWKVNKDVVGDLNNIINIFNVINQFAYKKVVLFSTIDVYCDSPLLSDEETIPIFKSLNYGSNRYLFELMVNNLKCNNIQIFRLPALFSNRIKKNILFDLLHNNNVDNININSKFQWYNLKNLFNDIIKFDSSGTYNFFTQPIKTEKIIELFNIKRPSFKSDDNFQIYDYKSVHFEYGYMSFEENILLEIKDFINEFRNKPTTIY